jgi:hypothetical protein
VSNNSFDEIQQRKAHRLNISWVRAMPDEMLERWYKLITSEYRRRKKKRELNNE